MLSMTSDNFIYANQGKKSAIQGRSLERYSSSKHTKCLKTCGVFSYIPVISSRI